MTTYSISDLGILQGQMPVPTAMNESGVVTGHFDSETPFRYEGGLLTQLELPSSIVGGQVQGISSSQPERITGWVRPSGSSDRAVLWTDGVYSELGSLVGTSYSQAWDVNDSGIVAGVATGGAFRLDMATQQVEMLLPPQGGEIFSCSINQSGHVAGSMADSEAQSTGLFFYDQTMHVIPTPGEVPEWGVYVNDADVIASCYYVQGIPYAFTYDFKSKALTLIHDPAFAGGSIAFGINNHGVVVGACMDAYDAPFQAMMWTASDGMRLLNDVVDMQSGWTFSNAEAINDAGQIAGWGIHNGQGRGYLLTPVEEGDSTPRPKDLVAMVQEIIVAGGGMGILLPSGDIIYPKDGPVDPDSPLQRVDAARSDAAIGLAMQVLARRISDRSTRALAEKAATDIVRSAAASAGSARADGSRSNWLSRLLRDIADEVER